MARVSFSPHKHRELLPSEAPQSFTLDEILEGAKIETVYEPNRTASYAQSINLSPTKSPGNTTDLEGYIVVPDEKSMAAVGKMKIDSSVNLFGKTRVREVEYSTTAGPSRSIPKSQGKFSGTTFKINKCTIRNFKSSGNCSRRTK